MSLSAVANPPTGPTPGTFQVSASGGITPYSLQPLGSPPNPNPMPSYRITGTNPWDVELRSAVPPGTVLYFAVTDANSDTATVSYTPT